MTWAGLGNGDEGKGSTTGHRARFHANTGCYDNSRFAPELWPIALFLLAAAVVALKRYRETLD